MDNRKRLRVTSFFWDKATQKEGLVKKLRVRGSRNCEVIHYGGLVFSKKTLALRGSCEYNRSSAAAFTALLLAYDEREVVDLIMAHSEGVTWSIPPRNLKVEGNGWTIFLSRRQFNDALSSGETNAVKLPPDEVLTFFKSRYYGRFHGNPENFEMDIMLSIIGS